MKYVTIIGVSLLIVSIMAGTTLVFSNVIDTNFLNIFRQEDESNSQQQSENEPILTIKSITYNKIPNANTKSNEFHELNSTFEIWTADRFFYHGNIHPFLMEIVDSDELTIINSQCFCSKDHEFPAGTSVHTTIGKIAYNSSPSELIDEMYILPDKLLVKVYLEDTNLSDTYEISLKSENNQQIPENVTLKIQSATYNRESNELAVSVKLWTDKSFSYFGNVHPFLIEIIGSENLTIISDQCFCSKNHHFPQGYSTQSASGWLATTTDPLIFIDSNYPIPEFISIQVSLENKLYSDIFTTKLY